MNDDKTLEAAANARISTDSTGLEFWLPLVGDEFIPRLNRIVEETGAVVVLSSTWRKMIESAMFLRVMAMKGFTGDIVDQTPVAFSYIPRGREIARFLTFMKEDTGEEPESFVILDDLDILCMAPFTEDVFVQTKTSEGLQAEHAERAIEILGRCG